MTKRSQQHRQRDRYDRRSNDRNNNNNNNTAGTRTNENTHYLIGTEASVVQKHDQSTGQLTHGTIAEVLTSSETHPWGIKVRLTDGTVGRIGPGQPGGATRAHNMDDYHCDDEGEEDDTWGASSSRRPAPSLADFMAFPSLGAVAPARPAPVPTEFPNYQDGGNYEYEYEIPMEAFATEAATTQPASEWACSACTFVNSGLLPDCELCQAARISSVPVQEEEAQAARIPVQEDIYKNPMAVVFRD